MRCALPAPTGIVASPTNYDSSPFCFAFFCPSSREQLAKTEGYELSAITGTGPGGRVIAADVKEFVPATADVTEEVRTQMSKVLCSLAL